MVAQRPQGAGAYEGRTMLEILGPQECWRLLEAHRLGRVGLIAEGEPIILPVNYVTHGRAIVFRTAGGTKVDAITDDPAVAFEIDGTDGDRSGWSVLVVGRAEEVRDPQGLRRMEALGLDAWAPGAKLHWIRITPSRVTGRRLPSARGASTARAVGRTS